MRQSAKETRAERLGIFGGVAQIERNLVARLGTARDHRAGDIVHALNAIAPQRDVVAMHIDRRAGRNDGGNGFKNITIIPGHAVPLYARAAAAIVLTERFLIQ
ncbi:MAG: hypothetical protein WDM89_00880 [Rhizomicrobium sp.]